MNTVTMNVHTGQSHRFCWLMDQVAAFEHRAGEHYRRMFTAQQGGRYAIFTNASDLTAAAGRR